VWPVEGWRIADTVADSFADTGADTVADTVAVCVLCFFYGKGDVPARMLARLPPAPTAAFAATFLFCGEVTMWPCSPWERERVWACVGVWGRGEVGGGGGR